MTDSKRWLQDGAPSDYARFFQAVRSEQPSPASLQRTLISAGLVGASCLAAPSVSSAIPSTAAAATGAATKGGLASIITKIVVASCVGAPAVGTTALWVKYHRADSTQTVAMASNANIPLGAAQSSVRPSPHPAAQLDVAAASSSLPPAASASLDIAQLPLVTTTDEPSITSDVASHSEHRTRKLAGGSPVQRAEGNTMLEEMALIDRARSSLRSGNLAQAQQSARDYNRRFAAGRFAPEALLLLMQASKQLSQWQAATDAARAIIDRFPDGPNVARAKELLQSRGLIENQ